MKSAEAQQEQTSLRTSFMILSSSIYEFTLLSYPEAWSCSRGRAVLPLPSILLKICCTIFHTVFLFVQIQQVSASIRILFRRLTIGTFFFFKSEPVKINWVTNVHGPTAAGLKWIHKRCFHDWRIQSSLSSVRNAAGRDTHSLSSWGLAVPIKVGLCFSGIGWAFD